MGRDIYDIVNDMAEVSNAWNRITIYAKRIV